MVFTNLFGRGPKNYSSPQGIYWTLEQLRTAASPDFGLENNLDSFALTGTVRVGEADVPYRVEHGKHSMFGWRIHVDADTPDVKAQVEKAIMGIVVGTKVERGKQDYIDPRAAATTSTMLSAIHSYEGQGLGKFQIYGIRFTNVPKDTYRKAEGAGLQLTEMVKSL